MKGIVEDVDVNVMTGMWATADAGCPITREGSGDNGYITVVIGEDPNRLDIAFEPEALTRFLSVAQEALADVRG